ncbi:hypothetical protein [Natrinema salinisoli]|uniref:hypothetical protein n=1 Tax=Natrinema salinisoli TaxID=2878535 RepID=UPI001CF03F97|nr:hypothetical protein [Natrinema salinisoli]
MSEPTPELLEEYDEEFVLGLFAWFIVPMLLLVATVISFGIAVKHLMRFVDAILSRFEGGSGG